MTARRAPPTRRSPPGTSAAERLELSNRLSQLAIAIDRRTKEVNVDAFAVFAELQDNGSATTEIAFGALEETPVKFPKGGQDRIVVGSPEHGF